MNIAYFSFYLCIKVISYANKLSSIYNKCNTIYYRKLEAEIGLDAEITG